MKIQDFQATIREILDILIEKITFKRIQVE